MVNPLEAIIKELDEQRMIISDRLADGSAKNSKEYKYQCGIIRGLLIARSYVESLARNLEINDE